MDHITHAAPPETRHYYLIFVHVKMMINCNNVMGMTSYFSSNEHSLWIETNIYQYIPEIQLANVADGSCEIDIAHHSFMKWIRI